MKEQLSALIDGEFDIENANHLLLAAKSEGELKQVWVSYHLIGDVMRGDVMHRGNMANRVLDALESEPTVLAPRASRETKAYASSKQIYSRPVFWSVAASVAAVMFVGLMLLQNQSMDQNAISPMQMADAIPSDYLAAHQTYAPNSAAYYIQNASYTEQR
jgi:sigma-E factor negative regulatory protein RseA